MLAANVGHSPRFDDHPCLQIFTHTILIRHTLKFNSPCEKAVRFKCMNPCRNGHFNTKMLCSYIHTFINTSMHTYIKYKKLTWNELKPIQHILVQVAYQTSVVLALKTSYNCSHKRVSTSHKYNAYVRTYNLHTHTSTQIIHM